MHIVITARGLYFRGRAGDFRRFLATLDGSRQTLADYLLVKLH